MIMYTPIQYSLVYVESVSQLCTELGKQTICTPSADLVGHGPTSRFAHGGRPRPSTLDLRGTQWTRSAAHAGMAHMYNAPKKLVVKVGQHRPPLFRRPCYNSGMYKFTVRGLSFHCIVLDGQWTGLQGYAISNEHFFLDG